MSEREPATAVGKEAKHTEVGSVFVSNYPPYSFWAGDQLEPALAALDRPPREGVGLGLYVHVPFCRRRCKFCYFKVFTDKNARQIERYTDAVVEEAARQARLRAIAGRPLGLVYVGGGTPSYISAKHLRKLFAGLRAELDFGAVQEITFECEPGTLTRPKLEAIREIGVTRLSLGVENFNDEILAENGRAHLTEEILRVMPWIREVGFDQLNVDLIAGMVGETTETWRETVEKTIALDADSVTIYQLELPYNTRYSRSLLDGKQVPVADWETKREWHGWAIDRFGECGYDVSSAYTLVKRGRGVRFAYRDALWHGDDLLGVGVSSFSHVSGVHYQNTANWESYLERVAAGESVIERAYVTNADERLTRELILQLKLGRIEADYFRKKFDVDVLDRYAEPLSRLESRGLLRREEPGARLTREGLLRADQLLPEFYAPQHQNARYT